MVCLNYRDEQRMVDAGGERVFEYTAEDGPQIRQLLMRVMQTNDDPSLGGGYREILFNLFDATEHDQGVDGLIEGAGF
ncbi:MAG: hypothetical protein ABH864_05355 [archaeon]